MFSASGKSFGGHRQPLKGGRGCRGVSGGGRSVCSRPAPKEGRAGRGRDFFRRRKGAVCSPARTWGGTGPTGGRRSQKQRRMFVSGSKEVRQAVHATAVCRGPRQQRGHAAAAVARTVRKLLCSMTDLHKGRRWYGMYICSALSPYGWRTGGPVLDDAVVVRDTAIAVPKCIFIIKTNYYKNWPSKGFFFYPAPVQKLNTFFPAFRQVVKKLDALPRSGVAHVLFLYGPRRLPGKGTGPGRQHALCKAAGSIV